MRSQVEWDEHVGEVVEGVSGVASNREHGGWSGESSAARWGSVRVLTGYLETSDLSHYRFVEISGVGF